MNNQNRSPKDKFILLNGKLESYIDSYNHIFTKLTKKMGTSYSRSLVLTDKEFTEYDKRYNSIQGRYSKLNNEARTLTDHFTFLIRAIMPSGSYRTLCKKYQALINILDRDIKMIRSLLDDLYKDRRDNSYKIAKLKSRKHPIILDNKRHTQKKKENKDNSTNYQRITNKTTGNSSYKTAESKLGKHTVTSNNGRYIRKQKDNKNNNTNHEKTI